MLVRTGGKSELAELLTVTLTPLTTRKAGENSLVLSSSAFAILIALAPRHKTYHSRHNTMRYSASASLGYMFSDMVRAGPSQVSIDLVITQWNLLLTSD